jgi:hypothetical protein
MENQEATVLKEATIQVMSDGSILIKFPEGQPDIPQKELEEMTRYVYENLRDTRIAQRALEIFKARLG